MGFVGYDAEFVCAVLCAEAIVFEFFRIDFFMKENFFKYFYFLL